MNTWEWMLCLNEKSGTLWFPSLNLKTGLIGVYRLQPFGDAYALLRAKMKKMILEH